MVGAGGRGSTTEVINGAERFPFDSTDNSRPIIYRDVFAFRLSRVFRLVTRDSFAFGCFGFRLSRCVEIVLSAACCTLIAVGSVYRLASCLQ